MTSSESTYFQQRIPLFLQLGFREGGLELLKSYIDLLWDANTELNLISRKMSFSELIDNHVVDCLLPLSKFPKDLKNVADFGSGGGLPGVLYAIQFPNTQFHLFEKSARKQDFLLKCQKIVKNIEVKGLIPQDLPKIELVTARGFKPLDVLLEVSRQYYQKKGSYFLLKGRLEKINAEVVLAKQRFPKLEVQVEPLISPLLEVERHLVLCC